MLPSKPKFRVLLSFLGCLLGCGGGSAANLGEETGGCNDGLCLGALACFSDLCVDPNWTPPADGSGTTTTPGSAGVTSTAGGTNPSAATTASITRSTAGERRRMILRELSSAASDPNHCRND